MIDTAADDYDRPSRHWEYDGRAIGTYMKTELLQEEYTVAVTGKDLYDLMGSATVKDFDVIYYVNGKLDENTIKASNMIRTNTKSYDTTGKGVLTQVFVDNDKKEITIASINTYLAQATSDYNAKKGTLAVKVFDLNATGTSKTIDVEEVSNIEGYKKDDYLLVNWAEIGSTGNKMEVVKVSDPDVMEDTKLNKYSYESYVVASGTQYDYGKDGVQKNELDDYYTNSTSELKNHTYNLYFDQYGYLAGVVEFSGEDNYLFLTGYDRPKSNLSIQTADAGAIFLDGTMKTIKVNVTETDKKLTKDKSGLQTQAIDGTNYPVLKNATNGLPSYNMWFKYSTKGEGDNAVYTLTPVATGNTAATASWVNIANDAFTTRGINTASVRLGAANATPAKNYAWGNDDSVFITVEAKADAVDGVSSSHDAAITKVKDVYTGMDDTDLEVNSTEIEATHFTDSVFAVFDADHYIIGAIVVGDAKNSNKDYAYAIKGAKSETYDEENDCIYWDFTAVVDGEIKDLTVKDEYGDTIAAIKDVVGTNDTDRVKSGLMKLTYDKEGNVVDAVQWATKDANTESPKDKVYENSEYNTKKDVEPDDYNAYNVQLINSAGFKLTGTGHTLYSVTSDPGLRLAQNAPVIVIQVEEDSKGNREVVYDTYSDLEAARDELVSETQYRGWISAVIGGKGAEYIVLKETNIKGLTTDDPSIGGGTHVSNIELTKNATTPVAGSLKVTWDCDATLQGTSHDYECTFYRIIDGEKYLFDAKQTWSGTLTYGTFDSKIAVTEAGGYYAEVIIKNAGEVVDSFTTEVVNFTP